MNGRDVLRRRFREDWKWLLPLLALYGLDATLVLARRPQFLHNDAVAYLDIAGRVLRGDFWALVNGLWSPLWPALLAAWFTVFPAGAPAAHAAAVVVSLVVLAEFYCALALAVADLPIRLFWLAALAAAVFLDSVVWITPDLLQATLILPAAAALYLAHKLASWRLAAAAGLLAAFGYLAKSFGFPWAFCLGAAVWIYQYRTGRKITARPAKITAVYLLAFLLASSFWLSALRIEYGEWTTGLAGRFNWYVNVLGRGMDWVGSLSTPPPGQRHLLDDPARLAQHWPFLWDRAAVAQAVHRNARTLARYAWDNPVFLLAVVCLTGLRRRPPAFVRLCAWLAGLWTAGYLFVLVDYRYLVPAMPLLFLAAAAGSERLWARGKQAQIALAVLGLASLGVGVRTVFTAARGHIRDQVYDRMLLQAAAAIRADAAPGTIAADRLEETVRLAYYSDRVSVNTLNPHPGDAIDRAAGRFDIRYLLWTRSTPSQRRELRHWILLWSGHDAPGYWVLFKRPETGPERPPGP